MRSLRFAATLVAALIGITAASLAQAQATRTWVSGVGDDANPCSRTAPCKTFARAISLTAAGGEIDALDPGGYGAVTITKSITIDGGTGSGWAAILNFGTYGIIINGAGIDVTLRNISINGAGAGLIGVKILAANKVVIENAQIFGNNAAAPNGRGISDQRTTGGQLVISDTVLRSNSQTGLVMAPDSGAVTIDATLTNVKLVVNGNSGLAATLGAHVSLTNCSLSGNGNYGLYLDQTAGSTLVAVNDSVLADNMVGIILGTGAPSLILSGVSVMNNDTGMIRGTGTVSSFNNNRFSGNVAGNGPFVPGFTSVGSL